MVTCIQAVEIVRTRIIMIVMIRADDNLS
jgi:hypothetical protein